MTNPNWNLINPGQIGDQVMQSFRQGAAMGEMARQRQDERELRKAMAAFSANPDDPAALQAVMERNPELAMRLSEYADKRAFNASMSEYLAPGGQPNALLGIGGQGAMRPNAPAPQGQQPGNALGMGGQQPVNALEAAMPPMQPGASFQEAFAPLAPGAQQPANDAGGLPPQMGGPSQPPAQGSQPQQGPDLSFLGEPQTGRDRAFLAMLQRDPERALKLQGTLRDNFVDRLKAESEFYEIAVSELSRMTDEAGWQGALQRLAPMAQAMGADLMASVPPTYPGPEAVEQLLQQALPVKERLTYMLDAANVEADNERADRNTDSLIEDRGQRRAEARRYNDRRIDTTRRGQTLTDNRVRSGRGKRVVDVTTAAEARKLKPGTIYRTPDGQILER